MSSPSRLRASCLVSVGGWLLASCTTPPPAVTPSVLVPQPPTPPVVIAPPIDPTVLSVTTRAAPKAFVLDGEIKEWGSLLPESRLKAPGAMAPPGEEPDETQAPPPPPTPAVLPPEIARAASHVAVALTSEAVLVAVELDETPGEGVWLGLGGVPAELPFPGYPSAWGNYFQDLACSEVIMENCDGDLCPGKTPTPPDELAKCKQQLASYHSFVAAQESRFRKLYKIEKDGVKVTTPDGQLTAVLGAKVAWKKGVEKTSVEVSLPLAAMPRLAEAPLATLQLVARVASSSAPPPLPKEAWLDSNLPEVVSYEPHGDLRAALWAAANEEVHARGSTGMTRLRRPPGLSFQPAEPLKVESVEASDVDARVNEGTLFVSLAKLGEVEVGRAHLPRDFVVILKGGKLGGIVDAEDSVARGVLTRNRELHLFSSTPSPWRNGWAPTLPFWSVIVVDAEGNHRQAIEPEEYDGTCLRFSDGAEIAGKKLDRFGFSGKCSGASEDVSDEIEIVHRWDERKKAYVVGAWGPKATAKKK